MSVAQSTEMEYSLDDGSDDFRTEFDEEFDRGFELEDSAIDTTSAKNCGTGGTVPYCC